MTSKISLFKLLKNDLQHKLWMLVLSVLASSIAGPVIALFYTNVYNRSHWANLTFAQIGLRVFKYDINFINEYYVFMITLIALVGAFIVSIFGFRYLFSKKMTDLYHGLPVKRHILFFVNYINGILLWLVPFAITHIITGLILNFHISDLGYNGTVNMPMLYCFIIAIIAFFSFYNVCIVAVMFSGSAINATSYSVILGLLTAGIYGIFILLIDHYFYTVRIETNSFSSILLGSSPIFSPFMLATMYSHQEISPSDLTILAKVFSENLLLIATNLIVMVFNLITGLFLYIKRKSELAENGSNNTWFNNFILFVTGTLGGLFFGYIVSQSNNLAFGYVIFTIIVSSLVIYFIIRILINHSFTDAFHKPYKALLCTFAAIIIFITIKYDLIGFDSYIPAKESIASAEIYCFGYTEQLYNMIDIDNQTIKSNASAAPVYFPVNDTDLIYELICNGVNNCAAAKENNISRVSGNDFYININLKNGNCVKRHYNANLYEFDKLKTLVVSDDYIKTYYPISSGNFKVPDNINIYDINGMFLAPVSSYTTDILEDIYEAYLKDFKEHCSTEYLVGGLTVAHLEFSYNYNYDEINDVYYTANRNFNVYADYTNTLEIINKYHSDNFLYNQTKNINSFENIVPQLYFDHITSETEALNNYFHGKGYDTDMNEGTNYQLLEWSKDMDKYIDLVEFGDLYEYSGISLDRYIYIGFCIVDKNRIPAYINQDKVTQDFIDTINLTPVDNYVSIRY